MKQNEDVDIVELMRKRPHLFILGAGATKATIPNGDKYDRQSPVMENFLREIGIESLLNGVKLKTKSHNIEAIYSELVTKPEYTIGVNDFGFSGTKDEVLEKMGFDYESILKKIEEIVNE